MKPNTIKLIAGLNGKQLCAAVFSNYLAALQGKEPPFTDDELTRAIGALDRKPDEYRDYYSWMRSHDTIQFLQGECRAYAMEACWLISIVISFIMSKRKKQDELRYMVERVKLLLREVVKCQTGLEGFGEVLGLDIPILARREIGKLEQSIDLYNRMAECYEDRLATETESIELITDILPRMSLKLEEVLPETSKERLVQAIIEQQKNGEIRDALDVLMDDPEAIA
jgi:hypothetical protein